MSPSEAGTIEQRRRDVERLIAFSGRSHELPAAVTWHPGDYEEFLAVARRVHLQAVLQRYRRGESRPPEVLRWLHVVHENVVVEWDWSYMGEVAHAARTWRDADAFNLAISDPVTYATTFPDCDIMLGDVNGDGRQLPPTSHHRPAGKPNPPPASTAPSAP